MLTIQKLIKEKGILCYLISLEGDKMFIFNDSFSSIVVLFVYFYYLDLFLLNINQNKNFFLYYRISKASQIGQYELLDSLYTRTGPVNSTFLRKYQANNLTFYKLFTSVSHQKEDLIVS